MIQATYQKKSIRLTHVWFAGEDEVTRLLQSPPKTDILFFHAVRYRESAFSFLKAHQESLIKTIPDSEDAVWATYGKHLKSYIKRGQREGSQIRIYRAGQITGELLNTCADLYEQMKAAKGIPDTFNRGLAECYVREDALVIVMAYVEDKPVGFNAYIADDSHFRAWLTAFAFREEEFDAQVVSRAHQLLEWETMRYCCQSGITSYDFGGISSFEAPNGIDKFKMTFAKEGQRVAYDNYLVGVSLFGKAAVIGYKLMNKFRR